MNIFMVILVAVFMVGFFMINSPSQRVTEQETEYAINQSDMRTIAQCASAKHNAQIKGTDFRDVCVEQNNIDSRFICLNASMRVTSCEILRNRRPEYSYIVTATGAIPDDSYNDMLEILEKYFPDAGTFGIFMDGKIMVGGLSGARIVPDAIIDEMELKNGQLVYFTQYEIPDEETVFTAPVQTDVVCPIGTIKTYRFGRWQCVGYNTKTDCGGDMIWDSELLTCVADETKKPLCAEQQTAVLVDSVWECVNPFPEKVCPAGMIARLNYTTLEWECVVDPNETTATKKCETVTQGVIFGPVGTTARVPVCLIHQKLTTRRVTVHLNHAVALRVGFISVSQRIHMLLMLKQWPGTQSHWMQCIHKTECLIVWIVAMVKLIQKNLCHRIFLCANKNAPYGAFLMT